MPMIVSATATPLFWLTAAAALCAGIIVARWPVRRRVRSILLLALLGLVSAAAEPTILLSRRPRVAVMVDLSASTRGAAYRQNLDTQLAVLLGSTPFDTYFFAEQLATTRPAHLTDDLPADRTVFAPPAADALVLLSDGQFELPATAPPVFAVIDEGLQQTDDASTTAITLRGETVLVATRAELPGRTLTINETNVGELSTGRRSVLHPITPPIAITATVSPGDRWPENDDMTLAVALPDTARLWIGPGAPSGYVSVDPAAPLGAGALRGASVVVLAGTTADAVPRASMDALAVYARDLGGTLVIGGGASGFAAGGWAGTTIDELSPLAATPPAPARQWIVLIDASGSMAGEEGHTTRIAHAIQAAEQAIAALPPDDVVSVATFASELSWLVREPIAAREFASRKRDAVQPRGPTNIDAALRTIISDATPLPRELLIISDGETAGAITVTGDALKDASVRPLLLLTGPPGRATALLQLIEAAGGAVREAGAAASWSSGARELARGASDQHLIDGPMRAQVDSPVDLLIGDIPVVNQTWPRDGATQLGRFDGVAFPAVAIWQVGAGQVAAVAFEASSEALVSIADAFLAAPRDPRFTAVVRHNTEELITVTAAESGMAMKGLEISGKLEGEADQSFSEVAPGKYELSLPRSPRTRMVEVRFQDTVVDRLPIAGRYPPEFDHIGLNMANLRRLALQTGGALIEPGHPTPLAFPIRHERRDITAWFYLLSAAAALTALLVHARRKVR